MINPLCKRVLQLRAPDGSLTDLTVTLGVPAVDQYGDYFPFSIEGAGIDETFRAHGIDSFQALKEALVGIRKKLDDLPGEKIWLHQSGFTGFPRIINDGFGLDFLNRSERLIDEEWEKFQADLTARRLRSGKG